jgi:hypothetical protein
MLKYHLQELSANLNIFPLRVLGMLSTNSISFESEDPFLSKSQNVHPHFVSVSLPFFKTTNAFTNSPIVGSGFPITAACHRRMPH